MNEHLSPAEWIARAYVKRHGIDIEKARDLVTLRCLEAGDATVFSYFVLAGHQPGAEVMRAMAFMTAASVPDELAPVLPFSLIPKSRSNAKAGKRVDPLVAMRDEITALNVEAEMPAPGMYEAAISTVHERVERSVSKKTIRNAYDRLVAKGKK